MPTKLKGGVICLWSFREVYDVYSRMSCHELGRIAKFNSNSHLVDVLVNLATVPLSALCNS